MIDTASKDQVISGEFSREAADRARSQVESWRQFIDDNRDEITALEVLYSPAVRRGPQLQRHQGIGERDFAASASLDPRGAVGGLRDPRRLEGAWFGPPSQHRLGEPRAVHARRSRRVGVVSELVNDRFEAWLLQQSNASRLFSKEQLAYLELIKDRIATNLGLEPADLMGPLPFSTQGGLGKARQLFGADLDALLNELTQALAA